MSRFVEFTTYDSGDRISIDVSSIYRFQDLISTECKVGTVLFFDYKNWFNVKEGYDEVEEILSKADKKYFGAGLTASGLAMLENNSDSCEISVTGAGNTTERLSVIKDRLKEFQNSFDSRENLYNEAKKAISEITKQRDILQEALDIACGFKKREVMRNALIEKAKKSLNKED